jgi:hypothetical protein
MMRLHYLLPALIVASTAVANTITLQQGVNGYDGAFDASIFEDNPDNGAGAHSAFFVGVTQQNSPRRALIRFDLTRLPAGVDIRSVQLELFTEMGQGGLQTVTAHRLTTTWGEGFTTVIGAGGSGAAAQPGDVTWNSRFHPSIPWGTFGGEFSTTASGLGSATTTGGRALISGAGMLDDVKAWIANPQQNHGWILLGNEVGTGNAKRFTSREGTTVANRPKLILELAVDPSEEPAGWIFF